LLGEAQLTGTPEGALVHRDHLLSVSDNRIEAFSIDDRSAPALASSLVTFIVRHGLSPACVAVLPTPRDPLHGLRPL
jgi:hypothetical protein